MWDVLIDDSISATIFILYNLNFSSSALFIYFNSYYLLHRFMVYWPCFYDFVIYSNILNPMIFCCWIYTLFFIFLFFLIYYIETLLFYFLCCRLYISSFGGFTVLPVSCPISDFTQKSLLYTPKSRATLVSPCGTARGAQLGGWGGEVGPLDGVEVSLAL